MLTLIGLILGRTAFVCLLVFLALVGMVSLIGHPGPFVLTAFSMAGLPVWVYVRGREWIVAGLLAAVACVIPVWLLILYTGDGDFTVAGLIVQICVLGGMAYGLAWVGLLAGQAVWLPWGKRQTTFEVRFCSACGRTVVLLREPSTFECEGCQLVVSACSCPPLNMNAEAEEEPS